MSDPIEPIEPEKARAILDQAMRERLGDDWEDEFSGWILVAAHDYMARVTKRNKNVDYYADLLSNVPSEEKEISPAQASGRVVAWVLGLVSLAGAFMLARAVGWF